MTVSDEEDAACPEPLEFNGHVSGRTGPETEGDEVHGDDGLG
jgi:hypothetical protein